MRLPPANRVPAVAAALAVAGLPLSVAPAASEPLVAAGLPVAGELSSCALELRAPVVAAALATATPPVSACAPLPLLKSKAVL